MDPSWAPLGPSWAPLDASWAPLGLLLAPLRPQLAPRCLSGGPQTPPRSAKMTPRCPQIPSGGPRMPLRWPLMPPQISPQGSTCPGPHSTPQSYRFQAGVLGVLSINYITCISVVVECKSVYGLRHFFNMFTPFPGLGFQGVNLNPLAEPPGLNLSLQGSI